MRNAFLLLALLLASNAHAQNFYNQTGQSIGRIDASGNMYDQTGKSTGRMDSPPPAFTPFAHPAVRFNK